MSVRRVFAAGLILVLVTACAPAVRNPAAFEVVRNATRGATQEYRIQPGDLLDIKFFYNPELNDSVVVRPDGRFSLQLANEISAAGLTPAELTEEIRKRYSKEIARPEATVIVRTFSSQRVYVDGEVAKPGTVPLTEPLSALQAVALAGGFKESARTNEVILIRKAADNTVVSTLLNLENAINGEDPGQDLALSAYDVVYVPRSPIANVNVWVDQYLRRNIPIPIGMGFTPY